jgi:hypothetical protein
LQVNNIPTVTINSNATSVCAGQTVNLTANGAANYTWTPGNLYTQSISPTLNNTTIFTARGLNAGCPARTATISITVLPSPAISIISSTSTVCEGELIALTATGANSYTWSNGATGQVLITTPTVTGVYSVTGINANNCTNSASVSITTNPCTGLVESAKNTELTVYPNPNSGTFVLEGALNGQLIISNQLGQTIQTIEKLNQTSIIIENLKPGIYFISNSDKSFEKKIVVVQ